MNVIIKNIVAAKWLPFLQCFLNLRKAKEDETRLTI